VLAAGVLAAGLRVVARLRAGAFLAGGPAGGASAGDAVAAALGTTAAGTSGSTGGVAALRLRVRVAGGDGSGVRGSASSTTKPPHFSGARRSTDGDCPAARRRFTGDGLPESAAAPISTGSENP